MNLTDSDEHIRNQVYAVHAAMHPRDRPNSRWVMPKPWLDRLQAMDPGIPPWPRVLIGIPITVTPHATEPYLVKVINR